MPIASAWGTVGPGCDFWANGNWTKCCDLHDVAFIQGGDLQQFISANWSLAQCVWHYSPLNAVLMFTGVMIGGFFVWKFGGLKGKTIFERITGKKYGKDIEP